MKSIARLQNLRIAPRKVRLIADLIRGKNVLQARTLLKFAIKRAALPVSKMLKSAVVSAKNQFEVEEQNLFITKITVDEGRKLKRWDPRSRGRAYPIQKKTSHITLVLDTKDATSFAEIKKEKAKRNEIPHRVRSGAGRGKQQFRAPKESVVKEAPGVMQRMFRRKSI